MYELGVPESFHIAIPEGADPESLFVLTIATLGDVASRINETDSTEIDSSESSLADLEFSASFFDAFVQTRLSANLARETALLASASYCLSGRPGSSLVLARGRAAAESDTPLDRLLHAVLLLRWVDGADYSDAFFGNSLQELAELLSKHFGEGIALDALKSILDSTRQRAYNGGTPRELLLVDIICAVVRKRVSSSIWLRLPEYSELSVDAWTPSIRRAAFPKELWPSQLMLGRAGIFAGASGVIQMPTSAGKTRSIEIVLRSAFLSGRAKLAVVVAPFKALCHEIGNSLRATFREESVRVNELSDALQVDFLEQIAALFGQDTPAERFVLVLTPEKFLYVLRQSPQVAALIGLVVYDEGHQFDSGSRGVTYELLLTEIKSLLPRTAQTLLVSAVIQNAQAIGDWLIGESARVVNGSGLLPTARAVAFASWIERLGQLRFYEQRALDEPDYFVPRVIEPQTLARRGRERRERAFPEKSTPNDTALYLGIRLVPNGAVAIFCGRKDTAAGMARRAVEIYDRGFSQAPPAAFVEPDEIRRMKVLLYAHFGAQADVSRAATLGIFVHHGTTPEGVRLAIEYGMQNSLLNFVVCTSTLAQGVNLPIRYLVVPGVYQAGARLKVRDFQNLIGRAGRSGMHTEGLIVFSDTDVFDKRLTERWRFDAAVELLSGENSESTTSSLLVILTPLRAEKTQRALVVSSSELLRVLLSDSNSRRSWVASTVVANAATEVTARELEGALRSRRQLIVRIESYLMAKRGSSSLQEFKTSAAALASETLAYHLADAEQREALQVLFVAIAEHLHEREPDPVKHTLFSRTLLGIDDAKAVELWVNENREELLQIESNELLLQRVWPLFVALLDDKFFGSVEPVSLAFNLADLWLRGVEYLRLFDRSAAEEGSKPLGATRRTKITDDDILGYCENTLGFECSLLLSAVSTILVEQGLAPAAQVNQLAHFQKALKYGIPDALAISCYEFGFADRVLAQRLSDAVVSDGFVGTSFSAAVRAHREVVAATLRDFPTYFTSVLRSRP